MPYEPVVTGLTDTSRRLVGGTRTLAARRAGTLIDQIQRTRHCTLFDTTTMIHYVACGLLIIWLLSKMIRPKLIFFLVDRVETA